MQTNVLAEYCNRRGWQVAGMFVDVGVSGAKVSRPQLDKLMTEVRRRAIDVVLVWRYDRFARSLAQLVNALEEFGALDVNFVSLHDGCDTTTPQGRLVFGIMASLAEFERELIRERVRAGLAHAKAKGKRLGRPRVEVDRVRVAQLRAEGRSWGWIARALGVARTTVQRANRA